MFAAFQEFHFLRPAAFGLLVPFAFLCWRLFRAHDTSGGWQAICDETLLPYLLVQRPGGRSRLNISGFILIGLTAIIALAGPTWERLPTPVFRDESALVIMLDLSRSMDATDISPSRLERAKFKITDMLRQRRDGQTALIVYAAEPFVVTPLTNDTATIESQLPALQTGIMPSQGSSGTLAIERGLQLLRQAGSNRGELLLLTDGFELEELARAKKILNDARGVRLSVLGVGTSDGAPIPDKNGGFIKDSSGNIVLAPLNPTQLRELAVSSGGLYQSIHNDDKDIATFVGLMATELDRRNAETTDMFADRWREFGPWLLLALLPLVPFVFRRGILSVLLIAGFCSSSFSGTAVAAWWSTPNQEAQRSFDAGDYESAAQTYRDEAWRAAAHYRADNYEEAAKSVGEDVSPEAQYNQGNSLARLGQFEEAIAAYDKTLSAIPDHKDAQHNKELIEDLLKQQQSEQNQQSDSSDDEQDDEQSGQSGADQSDNTAQESSTDSESSDASQSSSGQSEQSETSASGEQEGEQEPVQADADTEDAPAEAQENDADREGEQANEARGQANSEMENEQATEQWLRQIPDDPGGLLRRKFEYEYQKKYGRNARRPQAW